MKCKSVVVTRCALTLKEATTVAVLVDMRETELTAPVSHTDLCLYTDVSLVPSLLSPAFLFTQLILLCAKKSRGVETAWEQGYTYVIP